MMNSAGSGCFSPDEETVIHDWQLVTGLDEAASYGELTVCRNPAEFRSFTLPTQLQDRIRKSGMSIRTAFSCIAAFRPRRKTSWSCNLLILLSLGGCGWCAQAQQASHSLLPSADLPDAPGFGGGAQAAGGAGAGQDGPGAPGTLSGTVVDPNGDVVQGAEVVLEGTSPADRREQLSGSNGQFTFSGLVPETYKVTVTGKGMGKVVSRNIQVHAGETQFLPQLVLPVNGGVTEVRVVGNQRQIEEEEAEEDLHIEENQRVLGVVPNFYSAFDWNAPPLDAKQKFKLAFRDEIDPITILGAAVVAGGEEYKKMYPGYGSEVGGFGKRFVAQYVNDWDSRMMGSAVLPSLFHQDPRYFYKGTGTIRSRALYAIKSAIICRGDNGKPEFDFSHIGGDLAAGALANLYYPEANEGVALVFTNTAIEVGGMAGTNLIREFVLRGITSHVPIHGVGQQ